MTKMDINGKLRIRVFEIRGWRGIVVIIQYQSRYKLKLARDTHYFPTASL